MSIKSILTKIKGSYTFPRFNYDTSVGIRDRTIREFIKNNNGIIFGGKAINAHAPLLLKRQSEDYDVLINNPKLSAEKLEKLLDIARRGDFHYTTPAEHRGTTKIRDVGADLKRGTKDDFTLADFTKKRKVKTTKIQGLNFISLPELEKKRLEMIKDPKKRFRRGKDIYDLETIRLIKRGLFS